MEFDKKVVQNVAHLARLNLKPAAQDKFASEVEGILEWVRQLKEVDVDGVEPLVSVSIQEHAVREDVVSDGNIRDALMQNAAESVHGFYVVPKVVE